MLGFVFVERLLGIQKVQNEFEEPKSDSELFWDRQHHQLEADGVGVLLNAFYPAAGAFNKQRRLFYRVEAVFGKV